MKAPGIEKAARRLALAEKHLAELEAVADGLDVHAFEDTWFSFLAHLHCVPEIIKTSAKDNPRDRSWINGVFNNVIRKDPLLRFLWQARGTDSHGIEGGAEPDVQGAKYLGYIPHMPIKITYRNPDGTTETRSSGAVHLEGDVRSFSFSFKLTPVTDHHNNTFEPPTTHLGAGLESATPVAVARLAVDYYRALLAEARSRAAA